MILGADAAGSTRTATRSSSTAVIAAPAGPGRDARPEAVAALRGAPGPIAERVAVPPAQPAAQAGRAVVRRGRLPETAWLTAYRMLFVRSGLRPVQTVLVQGASGGVATALVALGRAAGYRMSVTGRARRSARRPRARRRPGLRDWCRLPSGSTASWRPSARPPGCTASSPSARRRHRHLADHRLHPGRSSTDLLHPAVGDRFDDGHPRGARLFHQDVPDCPSRPAGVRCGTAVHRGSGRTSPACSRAAPRASRLPLPDLPPGVASVE